MKQTKTENSFPLSTEERRQFLIEMQIHERILETSETGYRKLAAARKEFIKPDVNFYDYITKIEAAIVTKIDIPTDDEVLHEAICRGWERPTIPIKATSEEGNIYYIILKAQEILHKYSLDRNIFREVMRTAHSYDEALAIIEKYVKIDFIK
jgi:hypothetical protein